ncbi:DUF4142 domain-containing protein [Aureimonas phyllosphaerae]|uniref:Putative membrane protein n=1 Tax=Aureimonas phyllosphaerae TaxID=1166078 RepID=A0A7W6BQG7_9HYPH|nr:DUF4142 domain-containing protein [Aureimonas phyllosphaerae]MBB3936158.1 putative membrane protein [Aureimonas phyllosphaerae]MBB3960117.1 putative membrane protein [Aureimonas phyllosphaerae]SFF33437.1 putative membrane protein [Aureimonas phyllosphaerae]
MNRRQVAGSLLGAAVLSAAPGLALAQRRAPTDWMKMPILMGGDFSTATSKLAARKARDPAVREFAKLEITEQAAVAEAFGARPGGAGLRPDQAAIVAELEAANGAMFDMMYIDGQIAGHRELLDLHRRYARSGSDPMARGASLVGVTGIETHLFLLQNIKRQIA